MMTDREIYTAVFCATLQGLLTSPKNVTILSHGQPIEMHQHAHNIAMEAVKNAPHYEPTKLVEAQDALIKAQLNYVNTSEMPTPILEHYAMLIRDVDDARAALG